MVFLHLKDLNLTDLDAIGWDANADGYVEGALEYVQFYNRNKANLNTIVFASKKQPDPKGIQY